MSRFTRCAIRRLRVRSLGRLAITFIDLRSMRALNKRFLRHDRPTDVLSFRYDRPATPSQRTLAGRLGFRPTGLPVGLHEPVVGEILIAPAQARAYAWQHRIPYGQELTRYIAHGLLHWLGYQDDTLTQQRLMRRKENQILRHCGS